MAGVYIHIPFCKQKCSYCDFHFTTNQDRVCEMINGIVKELQMQKEYLKGDLVQTIYFGGGTPSILPYEEIKRLLETVYENYPVTPDAEITLEANPDDLNREKLLAMKNAGINRLSIGIQSFHNENLKLMNRAHSAEEAKNCLELVKETGFTNLSLDLIYGIPAENHTIWQKDLAAALAFHPHHISAYCLTIEEGTALANWIKKGSFQGVDEEFAAQQFEILMDTLAKNEYEQYEISNFCLPGYYSRHNSNYWKKGKYLGIGPSAHSYDGESRQFNVANNTKYLNALAEQRPQYLYEMLEPQDQVNEYIMTSLRTQWGCDLQLLQANFKHDLMAENTAYIHSLLESERAIIRDNHLILTNKGKLLADAITSELFLVKQ